MGRTNRAVSQPDCRFGSFIAILQAGIEHENFPMWLVELSAQD